MNRMLFNFRAILLQTFLFTNKIVGQDVRYDNRWQHQESVQTLAACLLCQSTYFGRQRSLCLQAVSAQVLLVSLPLSNSGTRSQR
jgi:hypothetical protein